MDRLTLHSLRILLGTFALLLFIAAPEAAQTSSNSNPVELKPLRVSKPRVDVSAPEPQKMVVPATSPSPPPDTHTRGPKEGTDQSQYAAALPLIGSCGGGFLISLLYLLAKFHSKRGFRIIRNTPSILFLICGTLTAGLATPILAATFHTTLTWTQAPFASTLGGGLLPLLERLFRRSSSKSATETKDVKELALTGFFFQMIWDDINRQMRPEVMRLANKFDGRAVRSATQILINNEIAIRRITREDGNKVIRAVSRIVPEDAPDRDNPENRYRPSLTLSLQQEHVRLPDEVSIPVPPRQVKETA